MTKKEINQTWIKDNCSLTRFNFIYIFKLKFLKWIIKFFKDYLYHGYLFMLNKDKFVACNIQIR